MSNLTIREMRINWKKVIELAFNRADWGKTYNLYTSQTATISCIMKEFNFEEQCAWFKIKLDYVYCGANYSSDCLVRYLLQNFTIDDFKMHLNKKLINLLETTIMARKKAEAHIKYHAMQIYSWNIKEGQILNSAYAKDYKEILKLSSNGLKEECIDQLKELLGNELNEPYEQAVNTHVNHNNLTIVGVSDLLGLFIGKEPEATQ